MAPRRSRTARPIQQLEQAREPFYIVSGGRVVFANPSLADWLGVARESLLERPVFPALAGASEKDLVMEALAPPPRAMTEPGWFTFRVELAGQEARFAHAVSFATSVGEEPTIWVWFAERSMDRRLTKRIEDESEASRLHADILRLVHDFGRDLPAVLVGSSSQIDRIRCQLKAIAKTPAATVINGPTGVGREAVARYLYHQAIDANPQLEGELLPIACPLTDASLMLSSWDLVAESQRMQRVTWLMLLEVDQLPADAQAVLRERLELCERRWVIPLATSRTRFGDGIGTTFDPELARRLAVFEVRIPSLAERRADIAEMAQYVLERYCLEHGLLMEGLTPAALDRLASYEWPENVAELEEVVAHAARHAATPMIGTADLPALLDLADDAAIRPRREFSPVDLDAFLRRVEREIIGRAYRIARGNKTRVARLLGISRQRVIRLIKEWGLDEEELGDGDEG